MKVHEVNPDESASVFQQLYAQSPFFCLALAEVARLHILKNQDYANRGPFSNFEISANYASAILGQHVTPEHSIAVLRGTKFARLASLTQTPGKKPNFESIEDTEWDFMVYKLLERAKQLEAEFAATLRQEQQRAERRARRQQNGVSRKR